MDRLMRTLASTFVWDGFYTFEISKAG